MWIEDTANGKYKFVEQYKDKLTGKRKRVSVTYSKCTNATKKQALIELTRKIEEKNKLVNLDNLTFKELSEHYLSDKKDTLKRTSYNTIANYVENILYRIDEDVLVNRMNAIYLQDVIKKLSPTYIVRFKSILSWGYKKGYVEKPTYLKIEVKKQKKKKDELLFLEKNELIEALEKLKANANTYTKQLTVYIVEVLSLTGLRIGELIALKEDDVIDNMLTVNKRNYEGDIDIPKGGETRNIAVNNRVMQIKSEVMFLKRVNKIDTNILFASVKGTYLTPNTIGQILRKVDRRLHPHLFRHTHASILAEQGVPLEMIQRRLGHKNDEITKDIYIHVTKKQIAKEDALFSKLEIL